MSAAGRRVVIAPGGNTIQQPGQRGTFEEQVIEGRAGTQIVPDQGAVSGGPGRRIILPRLVEGSALPVANERWQP